VDGALRAQIAKLDDEAMKSGHGRRRDLRGGATVSGRMMEAVDASKTRDYLTRDLVFVTGQRERRRRACCRGRATNYVKAKPGKGGDFRQGLGKIQQAPFRQAGGGRRSARVRPGPWKKCGRTGTSLISCGYATKGGGPGCFR